MPRKPPFIEAHPLKYEDAVERGYVRAACFYVSDGDTSDFMIDLGWYQYSYTAVRFRNFNAAELRGTTGNEKIKAEKAKERVEELILNNSVLLKSYKDKTTFERFVADVYINSPTEEQDFIDNEIAKVEIGDKYWFLLTDILKFENLNFEK